MTSLAFCYMEIFRASYLTKPQQTILIITYPSLTLTMEAASFSETSVYIYQCTRRHIPEHIVYFNVETVGEHPTINITTNKYSENFNFGHFGSAAVYPHPTFSKSYRLFTCIQTDCDIYHFSH